MPKDKYTQPRCMAAYLFPLDVTLKLEEASLLFSFPSLPESHHCSSMPVNFSTIGLLGTYPYYTLAVLFFGFILFRQLKKGRNGNPNGLPLPPGPKGYPLIGNLFDMPVNKAWIVYDEWRKTYGKEFHHQRLTGRTTGRHISL